MSEYRFGDRDGDIYMANKDAGLIELRHVFHDHVTFHADDAERIIELIRKAASDD